MNTLSLVLRDSATMLRRDFIHSLRNFAMTLSGLLTPTIMLLLFNYVYGGAMGAGLGGAAHSGAYINYLAPGILIMTVGAGCETTAINLVMDMGEGIIARFRTMAISRASVLTGTVIGSLIRTITSVVVVTVVALLIGFRPTPHPVAWIEALALVALIALGVTWMGVVFGLIGKTPAGANSLALMFLLLAFTSSAFVNPDTMPVGVRQFAEYQPFTPVIDTLRGLLLGTPISNSSLLLAVAWSIGLSLVGYFWARAIYDRNAVAYNLLATR
ncbi:MAG TPA: ABC transporter permease [Ktedonobacterales bacterium]|jgi:ABC-2 type transport system permease protein|nr:ABC transporter permease [Ktedonobacterales bacterium]